MLAAAGVMTTSIGCCLAANAVTASWRSTAAFLPLVNVQAVSCASETVCEAVGDGADNQINIIGNDKCRNNMDIVKHRLPLRRISRTISCPSASVCFAGGVSGIISTSDGGSIWTVSDAGFAAASISCPAPTSCTAVRNNNIATTTNGSSWSPQTSPVGTENQVSISCPTTSTCYAVGTITWAAAIAEESSVETPWTVEDANPPVGSFSDISCALTTTCVATAKTSAPGRRNHTFDDKSAYLDSPDIHSSWKHLELNPMQRQQSLHCGR